MASAINARVLSLSGISKSLKVEIWNESFQSFSEISDHSLTAKTKFYLPTISSKTIKCKWTKWRLSGQFAVNSNTFSNCVTCSMKNGHLHGNCSLPYIRLLHIFGGVIKGHNINQCNSMYVETMTKSTKWGYWRYIWHKKQQKSKKEEGQQNIKEEQNVKQH